MTENFEAYRIFIIESISALQQGQKEMADDMIRMSLNFAGLKKDVFYLSIGISGLFNLMLWILKMI